MTWREKVAKEEPHRIRRHSLGGIKGCPADHIEAGSCEAGDRGVTYELCTKCWDREIPETNLVVGDSKVEHPDTDSPEKKEEKKMIYAHVGYSNPVKESTLTMKDNGDIELKVESKTKIICISGKAQHGKDTTAGYLKEYLEEKGKRVLIAHYGDLVKYICTTFFDWDGQKDERGRSLLQEVGTDAVRTKTPDFWVKFIKDVLDHFPDKWDYVIIPDCRFPNEVEYLKEHGYSVKHVRVIRSNFISPLTIEQQKHVSEVALDDVIPDVILFNTFGLEELRYAVRHRGLDK